MADARIFEDLKADHDQHREMLARLADRDAEGREDLFEKLRIEITAHAAAEEESLYATMLADPELRDEARRSVSEHKEIDDFFGDLAEMTFASDEWEETFAKMRHRYEHHIDEEEEEMFPAAAKELSEETEAKLAAIFEKLKPKELARAEQEDPGDDRD
jgi:hemerythrin superfamily protein